MIGRFLARAARNFQFGHTSKGTEKVDVLFEIKAGEYAGEKLTWTGYFTDAASDRTMKALRTAGWHSNDLLALDGLGDVDVTIVVEEEEYNGKVYERIRWINAVGEGEPKEFDAHARHAFAARMRGAVLASRTEAPARAAPPPAPVPSYGAGFGGGSTSDDIPF